MEQAVEQSTPKVVIRKIIRAKRERVFEAWTNPQLLQQWMVPPPDWTAKTKNELRVGGTYQHVMIVGDTEAATAHGYASGEALMHEGEYLEIFPPERLVFTWNSHAVKDTRVTVELKDLGETTELWLTHELLPSEAARQSHNGGWSAAVEKLDQLLNGTLGQESNAQIEHACRSI